MRKYSAHLDDPLEDADYEDEYLNQGEEDQMEVEGYRKCWWMQTLSLFGSIFTIGLLQLVYFWFPKIHLLATHRRCSLGRAHKLLIIDKYENYKSFFIKNVSTGCINETSKEINYAFDNEGYDGKKLFLGSGLFSLDRHPIRAYFSNGYSKEVSEYRMVRVKKLRYLWVEEKGKFLKLVGLGVGMNHSDIHNHLQLNSKLQQDLQKLYGKNEIVVNVQSYLTLLLIEISSPYYFFQLLSILVWILDDYLYYTYAVIIVTVLGISVTIVQTHKVQIALRKTVQASEAIRADVVGAGGMVEETPCYNLVPGDRIVIPDNEEYTVPCDAVILSGSCIVMESMLTGESVPLTKTTLPATDEEFIEKECSNHMLFSGTKVIQTRRDGSNPVVALVLRTGYVTAKGDLVRAILYPPPIDYEFEQSIYTFINLSAIGALIISCGVAVWLAMKKFHPLEVFTKSFELLTMVIPAAIPGALALCKAYSIQRFRKRKIACINSKVINVAGSIDCVCFDKTGTITEDGLDIWGVVPVCDGKFEQYNTSPSSLPNNRFKFALASSHSLSIFNGKIIGDPLDAKMFESTGWMFEESTSDLESGSHSSPIVYPSDMINSQERIMLLHQNQFVSSLQRMSILTQKGDSTSFDLYCKGSPEMIATLSRQESVPSNLKEVLQEYTKEGYRVLALSWRQIEDIPLEVLKKQPRVELEKELNFLGLLVMENKVKQASKPTIQILKKGNIKVTMITGDNIQTAISVSRECDIIQTEEDLVEIDEQDGKLVCTVNKCQNPAISQKNIVKMEEGVGRSYKLALTGNAWEEIWNHHEDYIPYILVRTDVFARMASRQKQQVVTELQALGYSVAMCGDGANDCAALKASNVGVSLSEAEASVASPLSSAQQDISCIPTVVREGRSSLIASYGLIKFILCYGYIQLTSCIISYAYGHTLNNFEFIWEDIFLIILLSISYALTDAYEGELVPQSPPKKMLDLIPILSMAVNMVIFIAFQLLSYYLIQTYSWYKDSHIAPQLPQPKELIINYSYRNYALFSISTFQIIIAAIIFSQGYPYRKPLHTNYLYFVTLVVLTIFSGLLMISPGKWVKELFTLALPPMEFRYTVLIMALINLIMSYIIEKVIFEYLLCRKLHNLTWGGRGNKSKYEIALEETNSLHWLSNIIEAFTFIDFKQRLSITGSAANFRD